MNLVFNTFSKHFFGNFYTWLFANLYFAKVVSCTLSCPDYQTTVALFYKYITYNGRNKLRSSQFSHHHWVVEIYLLFSLHFLHSSLSTDEQSTSGASISNKYQTHAMSLIFEAKHKKNLTTLSMYFQIDDIAITVQSA